MKNQYYKILSNYSAEGLTNLVCSQMPEWQPTGGVTCNDGIFHQAVVKQKGFADYIPYGSVERSDFALGVPQ